MNLYPMEIGSVLGMIIQRHRYWPQNPTREAVTDLPEQTHTRLLAEAYMLTRGIGESAVDLIPDSIRRPWGPVRAIHGFSWTHTCGNLKLGVVWVRSAWH